MSSLGTNYHSLSISLILNKKKYRQPTIFIWPTYTQSIKQYNNNSDANTQQICSLIYFYCSLERETNIANKKNGTLN